MQGVNICTSAWHITHEYLHSGSFEILHFSIYLTSASNIVVNFDIYHNQFAPDVNLLCLSSRQSLNSALPRHTANVHISYVCTTQMSWDYSLALKPSLGKALKAFESLRMQWVTLYILYTCICICKTYVRNAPNTVQPSCYMVKCTSQSHGCIHENNFAFTDWWVFGLFTYD